MVFQTEKAMEEVGDKISPDDKTKVEADLKELKDLLAKSTPENTSDADIDAIKAAKEKLMTSAQQLFQKVYEKSQAGGSDRSQSWSAGRS